MVFGRQCFVCTVMITNMYGSFDLVALNVFKSIFFYSSATVMKKKSKTVKRSWAIRVSRGLR